MRKEEVAFMQHKRQKKKKLLLATELPVLCRFTHCMFEFVVQGKTSSDEASQRNQMAYRKPLILATLMINNTNSYLWSLSPETHKRRIH